MQIIRIWYRAFLPRHIATRWTLPPGIRLPLRDKTSSLHHRCHDLFSLPAMAATGLSREEGYAMDAIGNTWHMVD